MNEQLTMRRGHTGLPESPGSTRRERIASALATAPLLVPAVGCAVGILLDYHRPLPFPAYVAAFIVGGTMLVLLRMRPMLCTAILVLPAIGVGAALHQSAYRRIAADHVVRYTDETSIGACLVGTIVTEPSMSLPNYGAFNGFMPRQPRSRFLLEAETLDGVRGPMRVSGLVQVGVAESIPHLRAGDRVRLFGRFYRPVPPSNPGEPDWSLHQRRRGVLAGISCEHAASVNRIGKPAAEAGWLTRIRRHCRGLLLDDVVMPDTAGLSVLEAIILGQRSTVEREINDAFVATGTVHILSVSGSHLAMLAGAVWGIAALLGRSRRQTAMLVLLAVLSYAALAEPNAPVLRSAITATFLCAGLMLRRPTRTANWLAASAILVLAIRPTDLFDPGFQLSYVTLGGVIYLAGPVRDAWRRLLRPHDQELAELVPTPPKPHGVRRLLRDAGAGLELALAVSIAAWFVGAPLALYHFGQTSTWGWLNSLLIAPFIGLLMLVGFAKLIVGAIWPSTALLLGPILAGITSLVNGWVRLLAGVPGVSIMLPAPPLWLVVLAMVACTLWAARRLLAIPGHVIGIGLAGSFVAGILWYLPGRPGDGELRIRFVSVGNGTTAIVRLPNGRAFLYDAGTMPPYELYRSTFRPALGVEAIRRLDAAIVSHPDLDHFSGLLDLAPHVPIREVWVPCDFVRPGGAAQSRRHADFFLAEVQRRKIPARTLSAGDCFSGTGDVGVEVLWPPLNLPPDPRNTNESSIVLRLRHHGRSILLCGDIEEHPQRWLTANADVRADVLVLPHHGSLKPWTADFVRAVSPTYVIRSSGKRTEISDAGLNDLMRDYEYFNTADVGSVLVRVGGRGVRVSAQRHER